MLDPQVFTYTFATFAVIAQVVSVLLIFSLFVSHPVTRTLKKFFAKNALLFSFLVALVCMLGSLYYSEIAKYTPCTLCWYQRILMYPQVLLLGLAYLRREATIAIYSMSLSGLGFIIATYHYLLQTGTVEEIAPCGIIGYSVSCAENFGMTFGYITIPMMSMSGFALIFLLLLTLVKTTYTKKRK